MKTIRLSLLMALLAASTLLLVVVVVGIVVVIGAHDKTAPPPVKYREKWGYVEVQPKAHMFWWLYSVDQSPTSKDRSIGRPLLLWLQVWHDPVYNVTTVRMYGKPRNDHLLHVVQIFC